MVVEPDLGEELDARRLPTTTLAGWRQFVAARPASLTLPERAVYDALEPGRREVYNHRRIAYHSELVTIHTSVVREIIEQGRILTMVNQCEIGARRALLVSGMAATGKTTTIKLLGKVHEQSVHLRYPGQDRIPVVYITTPPKGSPRKLAAEFAHFLGIPYKPRSNVADIADSVCHVLTEACTDLVLVDEIHNLNLGTSAGEDMSDHLKYFTEHMPASFVYAGIEVEKSGLFTGIRGRQISARSNLVKTGSFPYSSEWHALVATLEEALRLFDHEPGTLAKKNSRFMHQRTCGSISGLSQLVRSAAIRAIYTGVEAITRTTLESVQIDHATESAAPITSRPRRGS
jgi:hypothetical protein